MMATETAMVDRALALAEKGFRVFPLLPGRKNPRHEGWTRDATTDPETIRAWWAANPRDNIGIETTNLLGVDVDNKNGKNGSDSWSAIELLRELPEHPVVRTPSGGEHHVFAMPEGRFVANIVDSADRPSPLGNGIDVRGWHGYLVAAGSVTEQGEYVWITEPGTTAPQAPNWLIDACRPVRRRSEDAEVAGFPLDEPAAVATAIHWLEHDAVEAIEGNGGDLTTYRTACSVRDLGISEVSCLELMLLHYNDRCIPPWASDELEKKVSSAYRNAQNPIGADSPYAQFTPIDEPKPPPRKGLPLIRFGDIQVITDTVDFVEDTLGEGGMSVCYGDSNSGKTFFTVDLSLHVALGQSWMGKEIEQGGVIYVAAEGGFGIRNRVAAFARHHQIERTDVPFGLVPSSVNLLDPKADTAALIELIKAESEFLKQPVKLVVIDTLARAMAGGNENSSEDMGALVGNADRIRQATGAHLMFIHHSGKDAAKGARGHSSLRAATDTEIEVTRDHDTGISDATITKQRDMALDGRFVFRLETVDLGVNRRLKTITSCAVVQITETTSNHSATPRQPVLDGKNLEAFQALERCIDREGGVLTIRKRGHAALDAAAASLDQWKAEMHAAGLLDRIKRSMARADFSRAKRNLQRLGFIGIEGDQVWIAQHAQHGRSMGAASDPATEAFQPLSPLRGRVDAAPETRCGASPAKSDGSDLTGPRNGSSSKGAT